MNGSTADKSGSMDVDASSKSLDENDEDTTRPATVPSLTSSVCPICSTELNKLARNVPYAHHSKSHVDHDPVVLPNDRIYGRELLERLNEKLGFGDGKVRDPMDPTGEAYGWEHVKKVFIS